MRLRSAPKTPSNVRADDANHGGLSHRVLIGESFYVVLNPPTEGTLLRACDGTHAFPFRLCSRHTVKRIKNGWR